MATADGLIQYDHGSFAKELTGHSIRALTVTRAGRLLASTSNDLFIALHPDKKPVRWSTIRSLSAHGRFQSDLDGKTWFGCGVHLCSWSDADIQAIAAGARWASYRLPSPRYRLDSPDSHVNWTDIVATPDHRIWGRNGPEVFMFANGRAVSRDLPVETFQGERPGFFLDGRGRLWIPGRQLHVVENGVLDLFRPSGAPLQDVTAVFEDRLGTLWFGLAGKGLAALPDKAGLQSWAEPEGISGSVLDLAAHPRLGLLAATNSGAYLFDTTLGRWQALAATAGHTALRSAAADADGAILSLPHSGGLLRSAAPFVSARKLQLPGDFNPSACATSIATRAASFGSRSIDGLFRMGPADRIVQVPLPHAAAYAADFSGDSDGRLWVGYEGGVARCLGDNCIQAIAPQDGLLDPKIRTIAAAAGEIWVGYRPGIGFSRFRQKPARVAGHAFQPAGRLRTGGYALPAPRPPRMDLARLHRRRVRVRRPTHGAGRLAAPHLRRRRQRQLRQYVRIFGAGGRRHLDRHAERGGAPPSGR